MLSLSAIAQAQPFSLPNGTTAVSPIDGRVTGVESQSGETEVSIEFTLNGCLDTLLPLISEYKLRGDRVVIYVTALNAHNEASERARCIAIPQSTAQITVPGSFDRNQVRVVFLGADD